MATLNRYDFGNAVVLTASFMDLAGNPADPAGVILRILGPDQSEQIVNPTRTGTGAYSYTFTPLLIGIWYYRFEGSGAVTAAMDRAFNIESTPFTDAA
jgi:hypothetical protein